MLPSLPQRNARRHETNRSFFTSSKGLSGRSESQRGLCAVCGNPETSTMKRTGEIKMLHIDHDHKTGKIRGLLCQDCNMALGHLQDSSERIQMLLDYAKAHGL